MPPRKKSTAAADASKPASSRASRSRAKASADPDAASGSAKPKSKRTRAAESDEEADAKKKLKSDAPVDDDEVDDKPAKMVTVLKRGAAPVDHRSSFVSTHQVYSNSEDIWDAMLNQTDLSANQNKNKFYIIQLLHPVGDATNCVLYTRWGRVGEGGQSQTKGPFSAAVAVQEFKKQFKSKTLTLWDNRRGMVARPGKYTWIERSFEEEEADTEAKAEGSGSKEEPPVPGSKLPVGVQAFCSIVFSITIMDAALSSMNYDARKLPLGKLAKSTILNGFSALKVLADVLNDPAGPKALELGGLRPACEHLSSQYYSVIPHDFGRSRPTVIDNMVLLKRELELVDALGDMEVAQKLITSTIPVDEAGQPLNPVDAHFRSLGLSYMDPIDPKSKEFKTLETYTKDTHGSTHSYLQVDIQHAFRVERAEETNAWEASGFDDLDDGERLLLWHGSRSTNFAGILKQGLRIAPPEAPVSGYMFGKGVYFADMMSKSAGYCYPQLSNSIGLLLLCEVAAKPFHEELNANYTADETCKKKKALCTKGIGRTQPVKWQDAGAALDNEALAGCHMPLGPGQNVSPAGAYLQYNEYIVYNPAQIRLRYLLMVNMRGGY